MLTALSRYSFGPFRSQLTRDDSRERERKRKERPENGGKAIRSSSRLDSKLGDEKRGEKSKNKNPKSKDDDR